MRGIEASLGMMVGVWKMYKMIIFFLNTLIFVLSFRDEDIYMA